MAKELPYFKFEPGSWDTGNIQLCSFEAQGVFINLCSLYWQRLGDLPYKLALQKVCGGNAVALDSLCEVNAIKVIDGLICIDFLNEQLAEFEDVSKTNSENARSGWEKRRNNAAAMRPQSDPNAIRGEKRREEERRGEKIVPAVAVPFEGDVLNSWNDWVKYRSERKLKLTPTSIKKQIQFLGGRAGPEIIAIIDQSIRNGYQGLFDLKTQINGHQGIPKQTSPADQPRKPFGKL